MRRGLLFLLVFVLLLIAPTAVRYLQHYQLGGVNRAEPPTYDVASVVESVPTPAAAAFVDAPESFGGLVLLDQSHDNAFTLDEIGYLDGRLAARGVEMMGYTGGDLATALRGVNAFVVITPLQPFSADEIQAVENFVQRGGRLLMLGDPTRYNVIVEEDLFSFNIFVESDKIPLNSLANSFDLIFNGDYLYNTIENEGNFRNIVLDSVGFTENALTAELDQVVLYGAHSLQVGAGAKALMAGDDNTWSSATDRPGGLTLAATAANGNVLAVGDIQFLMEPYYTVLDNARFIAQIADFLSEPIRRDFTVADFPYFFADEIDLVYTGAPELGPDAFDEIITLQASLRGAEKALTLATADSQSGDAIYLGLYNQSDEVADLLAEAGITLLIDPEILTEAETAVLENENANSDDGADAEEEAIDNENDAAADEEPVAEESFDRLIQSSLGNVHMSGTALILLDESGSERRLVVLAASKEGLENTVSRLLDLIPLDADYALADCLLQDNLALCPTNVTNEEVEAELLTGGTLEADSGDGDVSEDEDTAVDTEEEPTDDEEQPEPTDIDAIDQGTIGLGETVEGTLGDGEQFSWTFQDGPAVIDIILESGEDLDAVLELYDADNIFLAAADSGFTGEGETISGYEIEDDASYTILVRDFYADGGSFTLSVQESSEPSTDGDSGSEEGDAGSSDTTIFLFVDDDGTPIDSGFTSQTELETLLSPNYTVQTWVSSADGPLPEDALEGIDLLIWDSGDYLDSEGFFGEDTFVIFAYLDAGGSVFITGSSPTIFGDLGLSELSDLEFTGEDAVLLEGFTAGEIIELGATYEVIFADFLVDDLEPGSIAFLLRGANSDDSGNVVGLAAIDDTNDDQQTMFLLMPFAALPEQVQGQLLDNMMAWFGF
ncbi:MAG: hypothetical protein H6654_00410 [Ardenticatenaceae bacterium]|nr:hypothetical protein [Anaerolineales bacterium]MCB8940662.1 hypothetical protein [Ardenticatenaceae bacterium]MCB8971992.1 hypothetical protein [Ardenticatenaceae bacterium]